MSATTSNTTFPPGPPDGFQAFSRDPLNVQMDWWHTYGDIWSIDLPSGKSMVFLAHPDLVEQLFTNHLDTARWCDARSRPRVRASPFRTAPSGAEPGS